MSHLCDEPTWQKRSNTNHTGDPLAIIYNEGAWRLSKVSPLYNLHYSPVQLKQYSSKIRQGLVSAVATNSSTKYSVQIEERANLKYSEHDDNGLMINVNTSTQGTNSGDKLVYTAILLSWGVSNSLDNAIHLPYILERGEQRIGKSVRATMQTIFDCNIQQFSFTQQQLLQFGFNFVEIDSPRSTDLFTLMYRTPQADHKDKMNLSFVVDDIKLIWMGVNNDSSSQLKKSGIVTLAYQIMQNQIFDMLELDVTVFDLCEVLMPRAEVKRNGVVKMKTPEIVNCMFTLLNGISDLCSQLDGNYASGSGT